MNILIFFSGVEFGIPKAASDWPCVCVFLFCVVVQHTTGYPKDFLSLRRSNFVLEMLPRDVGKFGDWFA